MPKNVVCKKCNNLVNDWCEKVIDSPDQDMQRDCQYFCEKTNADRIRAMSDDELANILTDYSNNGGWITETGRQICYERIIYWLQQPSEVENAQE